MKLNELSTKTIISANNIYCDAVYYDGEGLSKKHLFQLMRAEDLDISYFEMIKKQLVGNFPFVEHNYPHDWLINYEGSREPLIELSGKIARVTFSATRTIIGGLDEVLISEYTIYTYLYQSEWYVL